MKLRIRKIWNEFWESINERRREVTVKCQGFQKFKAIIYLLFVSFFILDKNEKEVIRRIILLSIFNKINLYQMKYRRKMQHIYTFTFIDLEKPFIDKFINYSVTIDNDSDKYQYCNELIEWSNKQFEWQFFVTVALFKHILSDDFISLLTNMN